MRWCLRVLAVSVVLLGGLTALALHPAAAASSPPEGFNIITSPLPTKITTTPGQTVQTEMRIKNQGNQPELIKVGLMKFGATGDEGEPDLYPLTPADTYASWVSFSPSEFTAPPNVWMTVQVTIKVPTTASLGYYLAVTFSRASQPGQPSATNLNGVVASLVLLEVKTPNENRSLQLVDFSTDHGLYEYLPVTFNITLHNNGNIFISPIGNIFIQRGNTPVETLNFNDVGASILPGSNRLLSESWTDGFPVFTERLVNDKPIYGSHDLPEENLKWDFSHISSFRFGKYTAKLLVVYDNGTNDVPMESTLSFWVIPWKLMSLAFVLLVLIGFGVWTLTRSFLRKAKRGVGKVRRHG